MTLPQRAKRSYTTSASGVCRSLISKVYNVFAYKPFLSWSEQGVVKERIMLHVSVN